MFVDGLFFVFHFAVVQFILLSRSQGIINDRNGAR